MDLNDKNINGFKIIENIIFNNRPYLIALCKVCANQFRVRKDALKKANSCGCVWRRLGVPLRLRRILNSMKQRCYGKSHMHYARYGGRGIKIYDEWLNSTQSFYTWAMSNGYSDDLSIDRIDNDKGYFPDNCRWATKSEQSRNTKTKITDEIVRNIRNEPYRSNLSLLCEKYGLKRSTLKAIRYKQNWSDV